MAFVLPMAGVTHYLCSTNLSCVGDASQCLSDAESCCGETGQDVPDCLIANDLLPDAELPNTGLISCLDANETGFERLVFSGDLEPMSIKRDREPLVIRRMYVVQRRLLI
jgi:hypothetical protein